MMITPEQLFAAFCAVSRGAWIDAGPVHDMRHTVLDGDFDFARIAEELTRLICLKGGQ